MMCRHYLLPTAALLGTLGWFGLLPAAPRGQNSSTLLIGPTVRWVLVDVIATDRKGNHIDNLGKDDFRVFEDGKEQVMTVFSRESGARPDGSGRKRYMLLFFDDSTMDVKLQGRAREEAVKFVESTASADRQMAVVDFGGSLHVAQNFTADGELLKHAVSSVQYSVVNAEVGAANAQLAVMGAPSLAGTESGFTARSVLLCVREIAKSLQSVSGRKTMVLFSAGFALTAERKAELTATIDALNKANVAVYTVDVRGLAGSAAPGKPAGAGPGMPPAAELQVPVSPFPQFPGLLAALAAPPLPDPQHGATGGGTGGSGSGAASGPSAGAGGYSGFGYGSGVYAPIDYWTRFQITKVPTSVSTNQQVLYVLARGTGGFGIFDTNDFLASLQKIVKDMNEYYEIGYAPPGEIQDGSYHALKVEVKRSGVKLRYRSGYFDLRSSDLLKGTPEGKALEDRVANGQSGEIPVSVNLPYFYTRPGVARVNLALSVPGSAIEFVKRKGAFHSDVDVLGIAYDSKRSVAARFSDRVPLDYDKKDVKDVATSPFVYRNTFDVAAGSYTLDLAVSTGGDKIAKYEAPFRVQPFAGDALSLAGPALAEKFVPVSEFSAALDATALLEDRAPLVFNGMEVAPSPTCRFATGTQPVAYVEVYDPALKNKNVPDVSITFDVFDRKTNQKVYSSKSLRINGAMQPGNPVVPVAFELPISQLPNGSYRVEVEASNSLGSVSGIRAAEFAIE